MVLWASSLIKNFRSRKRSVVMGDRDCTAVCAPLLKLLLML